MQVFYILGAFPPGQESENVLVERELSTGTNAAESNLSMQQLIHFCISLKHLLQDKLVSCAS